MRRTDHEQFTLLHTLSTPQVLDAFFPPAQRRAAECFAEGLGFESFVGLVEPEPGWAEVLDGWRAAGGTVAVATNRGTSAAAVLAAVDLLSRIDSLVTIRDVARPKPQPDLLLCALERTGAAPADSVYVGDAEVDREAALRAGVPFLGFRLPGGACADSAGAVACWLAGLAQPQFSVNLQAAGTNPATEPRRNP